MKFGEVPWIGLVKNKIENTFGILCRVPCSVIKAVFPPPHTTLTTLDEDAADDSDDDDDEVDLADGEDGEDGVNACTRRGDRLRVESPWPH
jgi:hypothetical protein